VPGELFQAEWTPIRFPGSGGAVAAEDQSDDGRQQQQRFIYRLQVCLVLD
jgi:hypothetical protein